MKTLENLHNKSPKQLIEIVSELAEKLEQSNSFIACLQEELKLARVRHYGRKSEKDSSGQMELDFFDEPKIPENSEEIEDVDQSISIATHQRKKTGRKPLPKNLPRIQKIHDIDDADKICHCGCTLTKIGEDKSEQLDVIPAKVQVIEHIKLKYACKGCEESIKTASAPKQPIPKSIASAGLLATVAVSKYKDHLPLYRQENIFQRMGVAIARNTLANWMIKTADLLSPIYKLLQANIIDYDIAYADETPIQVLKEENKTPESKSYMWCFIGGQPDKRSIIYHYDPGRAHAVIEELLDDFNGYLHCDGFIGYDAFASDHEVKLSGCWMHARRKFVEVTKTVKTKGLSHKFVALIAKLYGIQKYIKENNFTPEKIYQYRQEQAKPVLNSIRQLLDDSVNKILPKSPLGKAIYYCINQWQKLIRFLDDGRLEMDNGRSERAIKPFVIGRKNWLFSDSVRGAKAGQIIYSIIETCGAHKIEPYAYLRYVLAELPSIDSLQNLEALLPYQIDKNQLI